MNSIEKDSKDLKKEPPATDTLPAVSLNLYVSLQQQIKN